MVHYSLLYCLLISRLLSPTPCITVSCSLLHDLLHPPLWYRTLSFMVSHSLFFGLLVFLLWSPTPVLTQICPVHEKCHHSHPTFLLLASTSYDDHQFSICFTVLDVAWQDPRYTWIGDGERTTPSHTSKLLAT